MDDTTARSMLSQARTGAPGPELARIVERLATALDRFDTVELAAVVSATQRLASWARAQQARAGAALVTEQGGILGIDQAATVVKDRLHVTAPEGSQIVVRADRCTRFPTVLDALAEGRIDTRKADTLLGAGAELTDQERAAAIEILLPQAPTHTWRWLSEQLNALNVRLHGGDQELRQAAARSNVWLEAAGPGMGLISALLPAKDAARLFNTVQLGADRLLRRPGQTRGRARCRADALTSLVTGRMVPDPIDEEHSDHPRAPRDDTGTGTGTGISVPVTGPEQLVVPVLDTDLVPVPAEDDGVLSTAPVPETGAIIDAVEVPATVNVTVPARVLADPGQDTPGVLAGLGPVPARVAREIAGEGVWHRLVTDPVSGILTDYSTTTYQPPARLRAAVQARDGTCQHSGCHRPAARCDLDHIEPFDHAEPPEPGRPGQTRAENLHALCRRHHNLKSLAGWTVERDATTGREIWTSPTGHSSAHRPDPVDPAIRYAPTGRVRPTPPHRTGSLS